MKQAILAIVLAVLCLPAVYGQSVNTTASAIRVATVSGSCSAGQVRVKTDGTLQTCQSGTWSAVSGSGSGSSISSTQTIAAIGSPVNRSDMPSAVLTSSNNVLLTYESFPNGTADADQMEILKRTSTDGGATWSSASTLFSKNTTGLTACQHGVGIPSLLRDGSTVYATMWCGLYYAADSGSGGVDQAPIYYSKSTDSGATWSTPTKITTGTNRYHANASDRLVKLASGRLIFPTAYNVSGGLASSTGNYSVAILYSDNSGTSWTYTEFASMTGPSGLLTEPGIIQHPDGTVTLYGRTRDGWLWAWDSADEGVTWGTGYRWNVQTGNTMAAIKYVNELNALVAVHNQLPFDDSGTLLTGATNERKNMVVSVSTDKGQSFSQVATLHAGSTAEINAIEPTFIYDSTRSQFHFFYSPSDTGNNNYAMRQATVRQELLAPTTNKVFGDVFAKRLQISEYPDNSTRPGGLLDVYVPATPDSQYFRGVAGISVGNSSDYISLGDSTTGSPYNNRITLFQSGGATGAPNQVRGVNNAVSNTVPALQFVLEKNSGASALASTDLAIKVSSGATTLLSLFGDGSLTVPGALSLTTGFSGTIPFAQNSTTAPFWRGTNSGFSNAATGLFGTGTAVRTSTTVAQVSQYGSASGGAILSAASSNSVVPSLSLMGIQGGTFSVPAILLSASKYSGSSDTLTAIGNSEIALTIENAGSSGLNGGTRLLNVLGNGDHKVLVGDLAVMTNTKGLILKSPDGTCYRFTVANGGALSAGASVTCP